MQWHEIADFARALTIMVRVQGPDPKGLKMRHHAFHHHHSGRTSLSSSGVLLPGYSIDNMHVRGLYKHSDMENSTFAITVASVVEPFLSANCRDENFQGVPELIYGASMDLMIEGPKRTVANGVELNEEAVHWIPAQLFSLISITNSANALESLFGGSLGSSESIWEVGWSLASYDKGSQHNTQMDSINHQVRHEDRLFTDYQKPYPLGTLGNGSHSTNCATRLAVIRVLSINCEHLPQMFLSSSTKRGNFILATGSPFGILSPGHFFNSVSVGSIANSYPPGSSQSSLLMADIRCFPGMEGGPVFGEDAHLVGVLIRPLKQKHSGAEVQLVIPWEAIATAFPELLQRKSENSVERIRVNERKVISAGLRSPFDQSLLIPPGSLSSSIEKSVSSVCLVTNGDGMWASGVVLNEKGLILTNAHLLEPWRFRKASGNSGNTFSSKIIDTEYEAARNVCEGDDGEEINRGLVFCVTDTSAVQMDCNPDSGYRGHRGMHVRLDNCSPWVWSGAKVVYVSKGPLDVALLQLDSVPRQLSPITVDFTCPTPGSRAYVIGHGIFGPQNGISPSVCSGVVAKVVSVKGRLCSKHDEGCGSMPVMVETTAAVHPGGSGGAIVNSDGHMIGLVTSNARHGGRVIPHLNFSIPCSALLPVFRFSKDMGDVGVLGEVDGLKSEQLSSVWALVPLHNHNNKEEVEDEEGKVSRFAHFIVSYYHNNQPFPAFNLPLPPPSTRSNL